MIRVELVKLLRRPRTWISVVLTCALPLMVAIFVAVTHLVPPPGQGSAFLSAVLQDGALYPAAALALVLPVFLPVEQCGRLLAVRGFHHDPARRLAQRRQVVLQDQPSLVQDPHPGA